MEHITILMAEDDPDDRLLVQDALDETPLAGDLRFVSDGEELLDYLHRRGEFDAVKAAPRPNLILLDLNMPRKDGREALREIKGDPRLRQIPVIVLTTSRAEEDVFRVYDLGANSFITKPTSFQSLVDMMGTLGRYWTDVVELPSQAAGGSDGIP